MLKKPKVFNWVALALMTVALSFPVQAAYLYGHSMGEWAALLNKISLMNWMAVASIVVTGTFVLKASFWTLLFAPLSVSVIFWNNYIVGSYQTDFSMLVTMLATLGFAIIFSPLLTEQARMALAQPHKRWWLRPTRHKAKVSATLNPFVGQTIHAYTFDISSGGAFISLDGMEFSEAPQEGDKLRLSLNINSLRKIRCDAVIVRKVEPRGIYPQGLGIRFVDLDKGHQKTLQRFLHANEI